MVEGRLQTVKKYVAKSILVWYFKYMNTTTKNYNNTEYTFFLDQEVC